jgi:putative oxidoreductase
MFRKLLQTSEDVLPTLLRVMLGVVMLPHGAQKALGWFGGYGFEGTMRFFTDTMHIPALFAFLAIAAEFLGALGLLSGLFTRVAALGIAANMAVAVWTTHLPFGFFMNWFGNQKGEGFEYHLLVLAIAAAVIWRGAGAYSLDGLLARRLARRSPEPMAAPA